MGVEKMMLGIKPKTHRYYVVYLVQQGILSVNKNTEIQLNKPIAGIDDINYVHELLSRQENGNSVLVIFYTKFEN